MKSYLLSGSLLLWYFVLGAQSHINGYVLDEHGEGVLFGNVLLLAVQDSQLVRGVVTDDQGYYDIRNVQAGHYLLGFDALAYGIVYSSSFELDGDQELTIPAVSLEPAALALEEVTVTARKPLYQQQLDRLTVNVRESATNAGATALEVLERSPGVAVDRINQQIALNGRNGVVVMINGRPERMDAGAVIQLLAGMPAANIDRIELISTPSSNFDAEGSAGLINIILVDQPQDGWSGSWTTFGAYGQRPKWGSAAQFFWRKGPWRWFANAATDNDYTSQNLEIQRTNRLQGALVSTELYSKRPAYMGFHNLRTGVDYAFNDKTEVSLLFAAHLSEWTLEAETESRETSDGNLQSTSMLLSNEINDWTHWMGSFSLNHAFAPDQTLRFTSDFLDYFDNNPTDYQDQITRWPEGGVEEEIFRSRKQTPVNFWVTALDYEHRTNEIFQWQAGLKASINRFTNEVALDYLFDDSWYSDENFSDCFTLDEDIFAAYWTGDLQWGRGWQGKIGGRYEWIDSRRFSERDGRLPGQRYGRLFPTAYLSYQFNDQQSLGLSYSERITRPNFNILAPAFFFFGPNTILAGNPAVRQVITRQLKLDYQIGILNWTLQYSDDIDPIYWGQPTIDPESNIAVVRAENMADQQSAMLSLNFPLEVASWWTIRTQASAYWQYMEPLVEGEIIKREDRYISANMVHALTFSDQFSGEVSGRFHSPFSYGLARTPWRYGFDLGARYTFGENRHQLSFSWVDIFQTRNFWQSSINDPRAGILYDWRYNWEGSVMRLTYSWQFGSGDLKGKATRQSASSEEQGRVN